MDEWTIKTPNPIYVSFSLKLTCQRTLRHCVWQILWTWDTSTHGWYFLPNLWTVAPMDGGTILVYCCPSTFSLTSPPHPFPKTKCTVYTDSVWLWGGGGVGVLNCAVDHILQEFYTLFLTRFKAYKIASPPQTKMTGKDDIKGLVSLQFLRHWYAVSAAAARSWQTGVVN